VRQHLAGEVALLAELADALCVPVPRPEPCRGDPARAVRYRRLPGTRLDQHLDGPHCLSIARQLGRFLDGLHSFPTARVSELGVRTYDPSSWLEQTRIFYAEARQRVFPFLDTQERRRAIRFIERHLTADADSRFTLMHGDLKPEHVLCDTATGLVTGVIDWTDARVGDPAVDFAWLVHATNKEFREALLGSYSSADPDLVERAHFYYRIEPWHILIFGLQNHRQQLINSGLAGVRARLA
jgi:aminoglycoside phosphotransferase (APT) family kinase protein